MSDEIDFAAVAAEYGLTLKRVAFCEFYIQTFNGTKAARKAGFASPNVEAARLLTHANVKRYLSHRFAEIRAESNEVLARVSRVARADIGDFLLPDGTINISAALEDGDTGVIKKFERRKIRNRNGDIEEVDKIELHDPIRAAELLGKHYQLWNDSERKPPEDVPPEALDEATLRQIAAEELRAGRLTGPELTGLADVPERPAEPAESGAAEELRREDAEQSGEYDK